jgi:hypothetical protein
MAAASKAPSSSFVEEGGCMVFIRHENLISVLDATLEDQHQQA